MYFNDLPSDNMIIAKRQFSQKTTFKDQFEVVWKLTAPYIDINRDKINNKTVGQSMFWRKIGNKEYTSAKNKKYLRKSIEAYTKSIAFAPVGSSELSLAYANRSAVLFKARLYEDCLLDIERALKAGYPDKLKTKLFLRQSLCFKALKPSSHIETGISMASAMQWLPDLKKYNPKYNIIKDDLTASYVMMPIYKIIKKSCDPNIDWNYFGLNVGFYASKPIKQGELISMSTSGPYHTSSKAQRHSALELTTGDPVPCKCIACIENWPTLDYLPSYQSMMLPASIKEELNSMTLKAGALKDRIRYGDTRELMTLKDTLNSMKDKYHQYITVPCREVSILNTSIKALYHRLRTVYDIID
ncbi:hypothetical protein HCN44_006981 [Aphidius gifuensis]|uniref:Uncharacterized protein n=1 Tax=Aphidius gifuensis TaxID=684658 RepID=A0A834Y2L6_APHGI|nr:hypothetical protein HCN44_006981 [Aphidius gifuensis]